MANYNYSFTFFVCFCFGLLSFLCLSLLGYVLIPFRELFLFSGFAFVLFSLLDYRFGSCVSVLGLRLSVFLFCFYRPQYKLNRYSVASKLQTTEDNFTRQRISRGDFTEIV